MIQRYTKKITHQINDGLFYVCFYFSSYNMMFGASPLVAGVSKLATESVIT